jgi:hypothetical protein
MWPFTKKPSKHFDSWPIVRTKPVSKTYGRAISVFINNGSCHLVTVDAYADGAIDCWGFVDRALFLNKLRSNWVVPAPKPGQDLSVFDFGYTGIDRAVWVQTSQSIAQVVESTIRELNPGMSGLLDMHGSNEELRGNVRYAKLGLADEKPFRREQNGTDDILGGSVPVLRIVEGAFEMTRLTVFADGMCQIGSDGTLVPVQEIRTLYDQGRICNAAPRGSRILLPGLGEFWTTTDFGGVTVHDRIGEIQDMLNEVNGRPGVIKICMERFEAYRREPSEQAKEQLRDAYEAVPGHLRMYCGDMDSKDWPIRAVLYGPEHNS